MQTWLLTAIIFSPLLGVLLLWLPPRGSDRSIRRSALFYSVVTFGLAVFALFKFYGVAPTDSQGDPKYLLQHWSYWLGDVEVMGDVADVEILYHVGVDGISIWLMVLTAFLMPLAIWSSFTSVRTRVREYFSLLLLLEVGLLGVFCAMDLLLFYIFFEFTLVPLYFLIGIWGGPARRKAANKFFIFTLSGSVFMFAAVLFLAYYSYSDSGLALGYITLNIEKLSQLAHAGFISTSVQWWLFLAFAAGFAIKVPLFPVHTWLPLAHTEAPTAGSVILAGVLLKLGTYGFCRISLPMFPHATMTLAPFVACLAIAGIIYTALAAWVQTDVKKLVAYSSVSHLGFCILGLFSLKITRVNGAVIYMINHGLSTGALFLIIGYIYERYHTRDINEIGGLARKMPWLTFFLVFFTLSSIGLPGLNGFVGEFLVLLGTATSNTTNDLRAAGPLGYGYAIPAAIGIILGAVYMLWMCQRVLFGPLKEPPNTPDTSTGLSADLTGREIFILVPVAVLCLAIGVYPNPLLDTFTIATEQHVLRTPASHSWSVTEAGDDLQEEIKRADPMRLVESTSVNNLERVSVGNVGSDDLSTKKLGITPVFSSYPVTTPGMFLLNPVTKSSVAKTDHPETDAMTDGRSR